MEVTLALLADASNVTENKKLNLLGVFSNINAPVLPYVHPSMSLVVRFEADPVESGAEKAVDIVLVDPDGRELHKLGLHSTLPEAAGNGQPLEMLVQLAIHGARFERPGPHAFVILVNGEAKRRLPLMVTAPADSAHDDE